MLLARQPAVGALRSCGARCAALGRQRFGTRSSFPAKLRLGAYTQLADKLSATLARDASLPVPEREYALLMEYLSGQMRSPSEEESSLAGRCLAVYALALSGRAEPAYHEHHGLRAEARRCYAELSPEARDWSNADLQAARDACPSKLDFAQLLPGVAAGVAILVAEGEHLFGKPRRESSDKDRPARA